ncbi:MAG: LacI family DNA-binding transcriptional regulator [Spirochaetales bacterium]|nr:LacI family DNA-binding transcriptional regulator [Spirochaetales bacterium]
MVTIKEIADAAGVSIGTVDRILHNRGRFSEKTAEKVHKLVKDLGYTPNLHARGLKKSTQHSFSVVMPNKDQDNGYWNLILEGINSSLTELSSQGTKLNIYHFDRYSSISCKLAYEKAFNDDSLGILAIPVRTEESRTLLESQPKPFLFIDSDIPNIKNKITYIGQDSYKSGVLSAKLMSLLVKEKSTPTILVIDPYGDDNHLKNRLEGFLNSIKERIPNVIVNIIKSNIDHKTDTSLIENLKDEENLPCGIFVANSMVYTIANYLNNKGDKFRKIPLIGYDIIPNGEDLVINETIDFIITQQPKKQGYIGIKSLYDHLILLKKIDDQIIIPMNIITKENISTF